MLFISAGELYCDWLAIPKSPLCPSLSLADSNSAESGWAGRLSRSYGGAAQLRRARNVLSIATLRRRGGRVSYGALTPHGASSYDAL